MSFFGTDKTLKQTLLENGYSETKGPRGLHKYISSNGTFYLVSKTGEKWTRVMAGGQMKIGVGIRDLPTGY